MYLGRIFMLKTFTTWHFNVSLPVSATFESKPTLSRMASCFWHIQGDSLSRLAIYYRKRT